MIDESPLPQNPDVPFKPYPEIQFRQVIDWNKAQAAIALKVPMSGIPELDDMIHESRRLDMATAAMQPDMVKEAGAVIEAARCIRHWHDAANDGMVVSAEHVMKLWAALDEYDAMSAAAEGKK